jgi:ParB family chromosome partitioning protein
VIQPLLVRPHPNLQARAVTPYMLIVGERRWMAARRAGLAAVPASIRHQPLSASDRLMMQVAENDGELREELSLLDLAGAVARAFAGAGCSQARFAQRHHRSPAWISQLLSLARAEGPVRDALQEGAPPGGPRRPHLPASRRGDAAQPAR